MIRFFGLCVLRGALQVVFAFHLMIPRGRAWMLRTKSLAWIAEDNSEWATRMGKEMAQQQFRRRQL